MASLFAKIRRSSWWREGITAVQAQGDLARLEARHNRERIAAWRHKLQESDKECFRWLRATAEPVSHCIYDDEAPQPARSTTSADDALWCLVGFWQRIWNRSRHGEVDIRDYLQQEGPGFPTHAWDEVTPSLLLSCVRKQVGKSPGLDHWRAEEILAFPENIWEHLAIVFQCFESLGKAPSQ